MEALHRHQAYVASVIVVALLHVPPVVLSVWPTCGVPVMVGRAVLTGSPASLLLEAAWLPASATSASAAIVTSIQTVRRL